MLKKMPSVILVTLCMFVAAAAQEVEVDRYNISVRIDPQMTAIDVRAGLAISNLSQAPKPKLFFRLNKFAKVSSATVDGTAAEVEATEDRRLPTLNQITVTPRNSLPGGGKANIEINYRLEALDSTPLLSVYPGEILAAPESVWIPMPSTMFTLYGATTAPFSLSVSMPAGASGYKVGSSGSLKKDASGQTFTFEEKANSIPFFIAGAYDEPFVSEQGPVRIEVFTQPGINTVGAAQEGVSQSRRLAEEARRVIEFYSKALWPAPQGETFRIISSARSGNVTVPGAVVLNEKVFRQDLLDAGAIELVADAVARMWIEQKAKLRGREARSTSGQPTQAAVKPRSVALIRDSLPRYIASLYFEERFGKEAAKSLYSRFRWSYTPIAKSARDGELGLQTLVLPSYSAAVFSKGPLVLRLLAETMGRDKLISAIRPLLTGSGYVTNEDLRQALATAGGETAAKAFEQWVDSIIEPDLVVGAPLPGDSPGTQKVNVRNLGTGDVLTSIVGTTASGKQITGSVVIPSENLTTTTLKTDEKIVSIEVDPEKLVIQTNYDNDFIQVDQRQRRFSSQTLFNESIVAFNKGDHAVAETKLREAVRVDPDNARLHGWLSRVLAAQNRNDDAIASANAALKIEPRVSSALAWAHITLGQIALAKNQGAEAVGHLRRAVIEADEAPAQFASRDLLIKAERAANSARQPDDSLRSYFNQLDSAIRQPASERLFALITRSNLKRFVQGLTVAPPSAWSTEILRVDQIDANRVSVDVALRVKADGRDQSGTALYGLRRSGSGWMLEEVSLFDVK